MIEKLHKSEAEWKALLSAEEYRVLRGEGTELCGTHPYNFAKQDGTFVCAGCFLPVFTTDTKFDSGTGWPSFFQALPDALETKTDHHIGYARTEYHCARCGGHMGHVFDDGPRATGLRYCNNGESLAFVPQGEALPSLRT